jgi:hypothetical protein
MMTRMTGARITDPFVDPREGRSQARRGDEPAGAGDGGGAGPEPAYGPQAGEEAWKRVGRGDTVEQLVEWVDDDPERAEAVMAAEDARPASERRKSLYSRLRPAAG